jgi:hypothetical protein
VADFEYLPATVNIKGKAGDKVIVPCVFTDSGGTLQNMTGTWTAYLRTNLYDAGTIGQGTIDTSGTATGTVSVSFGTTLTASLLTGFQTSWSGYWDLQRDQGSGAVRTMLAGAATFSLDATR